MKILLSLLLLCASTVLLNAQSTITGSVTDEKGVPLEGASILLEGTNESTLSDAKGFYSIQVPNEKPYSSLQVLVSIRRKLRLKDNL